MLYNSSSEGEVFLKHSLILPCYTLHTNKLKRASVMPGEQKEPLLNQISSPQEVVLSITEEEKTTSTCSLTRVFKALSAAACTISAGAAVGSAYNVFGRVQDIANDALDKYLNEIMDDDKDTCTNWQQIISGYDGGTFYPDFCATLEAGLNNPYGFPQFCQDLLKTPCDNSQWYAPPTLFFIASFILAVMSAAALGKACSNPRPRIEVIEEGPSQERGHEEGERTRVTP